jgi:hypothetical protein
MSNGGQIKELVSISRSLIQTSGNIVNDLAQGLSKVIGGVSNGLELVAKDAGSTLNNLGKNLEIVSVKVVSRVGDLGLKASKDLGHIIEIIPILGKPAAFVVKGAGTGIYYVVTSVGHVVGKSVSTTGKLGKDVSDLVVFTIASASSATEKTVDEAGKVVKDVAYSLTNSKGKGKTRRHRKHHNKTRKY